MAESVPGIGVALVAGILPPAKPPLMGEFHDFLA